MNGSFITKWTTITKSGYFYSESEDEIVVSCWDLLIPSDDFENGEYIYFDDISFSINGKELLINGDFETDEFVSFSFRDKNGQFKPVSSDMIEIGDVVVFDKTVDKIVDVSNVYCEFNDGFRKFRVFFTVRYTDGSTMDLPVSLASCYERKVYNAYVYTLSYGGKSIQADLVICYAYAQYDDDKTLTFYFDTHSKERGKGCCDVGEKLFRNHNRATKIVFGKSFVGYKPRDFYEWFAGFSDLTEIEGIEYLNTENVGCLQIAKNYQNLTAAALRRIKLPKWRRCF